MIDALIGCIQPNHLNEEFQERFIEYIDGGSIRFHLKVPIGCSGECDILSLSFLKSISRHIAYNRYSGTCYPRVAEKKFLSGSSVKPSDDDPR